MDVTSRAQIKVEVNDKITIERTQYRVADHPALPGIPYIQRGARGFVIQLIAPNGDKMALKYFKLKYRVPALVTITESLKRYADLPGLRAARRSVFTLTTHGDLLRMFPALEYGVLMPWLPGVTWYDVVTRKAPLSAPESLKLAKAAAEILSTFEAHSIAHCDIAGANVMVDRRSSQVELVDIEEMYGEGLPQPVELPAGQDGYQHRTSRSQGQWSAVGDRFGAAILIAEMLGWADSRIRQNSADEHYFSAAEMQDVASPRYRLLYEVLRDLYAPPVAEAFEQTWRSQLLADCPPIKHWYDALDAVHIQAPSPQPSAPSNSGVTSLAPSPNPSPIVSGRRAIDGVPIVVNPKLTPPTDITPPNSQANANGQDSPPDQAGPERIKLEGTKLCRNCGAQNPTTAAFCKRCGFYIGTGARPTVAPARPSILNRPKTPSAVPPPSTTVANTAPQKVDLQRDNTGIIQARRVGGSDGEMKRVVLEKPAEKPVDANFGMYLVVALIIAAVLAGLIIAVVAK